MDHRFLEFWGNLLLQTARGQKHMEEILDWWRQGFDGVKEFNVLLGKFYGLGPQKPGATEKEEVWEEALRSFQKSFQDYFSLFGYVPRTDYERLQSECQTLRKKSERQEETIRQLQAVLTAQTLDPSGLAKSFQDLIRKQIGQFQRLWEEMVPNDKKNPSTGGNEEH